MLTSAETDVKSVLQMQQTLFAASHAHGDTIRKVKNTTSKARTTSKADIMQMQDAQNNNMGIVVDIER